MHDEYSRHHKVQAMIDRAKNKAAEEDAKGVFNVTRKLLAEAKQAAALINVEEREDFITAINEVLTYCRMQTDAKKESETRKATTSASVVSPSPSAAPAPAGAGAAQKPAQAATSTAVKKAEERSNGTAPAAASVKAANPKAFTAPASQIDDDVDDESSSNGTGAKMANSNVMVRKASMMVTQKKPATVTTAPVNSTASASAPNAPGLKKAATTMNAAQKKGSTLSEKERLVAALSAKKVLSKVGKLQKEGGGKSLLGRKTWKERLFELSESSLEYYEKSNTTEKPLGTISLHDVSTARSCTVANKSFCFEVVTAERTLQIQAASDVEKEEWVRAIQNNVDRLKLQKKIKTLG